MKAALLLCSLLFLQSLLLWGGTFAEVGARTAGGDRFQFPHDALGDQPVLFALAMGTTQSSGELQQEQLLQWHRHLMDTPLLLRGTEIFHFPVIGSAPRLVRGLIRRGIGRSYSDDVSPDRAAVLFVSDEHAFARQAGIPLDEKPTLALVLPSGEIAGYVKGPLNDQNLQELQELLDQHR